MDILYVFWEGICADAQYLKEEVVAHIEAGKVLYREDDGDDPEEILEFCQIDNEWTVLSEFWEYPMIVTPTTGDHKEWRIVTEDEVFRAVNRKNASAIRACKQWAEFVLKSEHPDYADDYKRASDAVA